MTQSELRKEIIRLREDKINMQRQRHIDLKLLTKLSIEASIKHSKLVTKHTDHSHNLLKLYTENKAENKRLLNVIDIKQREIDDLNSKQIDLLWDLSKLEKEISEFEKERVGDEERKAHTQKQLKKYFNKESVDN